ncbi:MAG: UbiA family prenyltransferase [Planctomycetes bacterium]|nr:UbiA family prenyltransferase [Planctomycetota bacterium]MCW8134650.1 UbiA family prenyltransferase [Planctomycetota bacterium]
MSATYFPSDEIVARYRGQRALRGYIRLARPFTLIPPMLGMASGGIVAWFVAGPSLVSGRDFLVTLLLGTVAAGLLNAASNALNQIFDIDIDRINKPDRPLCTGDVSILGAGVFAAFTGASALIIASAISVLTGHWGTLALFAAAGVFSAAYSVPPVRTKARGWWANVTVAIPRGVLLKVAGWSLAKSVLSWEAWFIGLIMGLFLFGATTTKDFADVRGDAAYGVRTLPVLYGPERAARYAVPFLTLPFLLIPLGGLAGVLTARMFDLAMLGLISLLWGAHISARVLDDPDALTHTENHPAWRHMYYLMIFLQVGFVFAYIPYSFFGGLFRG